MAYTGTMTNDSFGMTIFVSGIGYSLFKFVRIRLPGGYFLSDSVLNESLNYFGLGFAFSTGSMFEG